MIFNVNSKETKKKYENKIKKNCQQEKKWRETHSERDRDVQTYKKETEVNESFNMYAVRGSQGIQIFTRIYAIDGYIDNWLLK